MPFDVKRIAAALALLALAALLLWLARRVASHAPLATTNHAPPAPLATTASQPLPLDAQLARSSLADALNSPATDIRADLRLVSEILATFRSNFAREGNPVGTNAEITAALVGRNQLRLSLIPADHPAINSRGELCDRWGTPFFFHAESAAQMEIRSAGRDRRLWTEDDVVQTP